MTGNPAIFSERCLAAFGAGHFLLVGEGVAEHLAALRKSGVPAEGVWGITELSGRLAALSGVDASATVIVFHALDGLEEMEIGRWVKALLASPAVRAVCLVAAPAPGTEGSARDTAWWQARFFAAGFRQHARSFVLQEYAEREQPSPQAILSFEKIPEAALRRYPLAALEKERQLHMDMLREPGRRSDAYLVRYVRAAAYVRPGDTVLDCACGLGYGAHLLYQNSRARHVFGIDFSASVVAYAAENYGVPGVIDFSQGDAQDLSLLGDNSVDFITSFETIEHLPDPERYLRELKRVLRPSGRVMFSAPDKWVDETGKDPTPYHLHVYDWEKLFAQAKEHFIPEKGFIQIAGGAMRLYSGKRHWEEVPCEPEMDRDADWVILLAMKDPLLGRDVPYEETTFPDTDDPAYHVGAFKREYLNPYLLKGIVTRGFRLENRAALNAVQENVLGTYPEDSSDYGAALCGKCYSLLEEEPEKLSSEDGIFVQISRYASLSPASPTQLRWQVSILFAAALLRQARGECAEAEELFMRCAATDVSPYSPLLGNKTLDALFQAAIFAVERNAVSEARERLRASLRTAVRLARGEWLNAIHTCEEPFEPGFPEMASLMDKAARACYALGELDTRALRPGLSQSLAKGFFESQAAYKDSLLHGMREYGKGLLRIVCDYEKKVCEQDASWQRYAREQAAAQTALLEKIEACNQQLIASNQQLAAYRQQISEKDALISGYENSRSWRLTRPLRSVSKSLRRIRNAIRLI